MYVFSGYLKDGSRYHEQVRNQGEFIRMLEWIGRDGHQEPDAIQGNRKQLPDYLREYLAAHGIRYQPEGKKYI